MSASASARSPSSEEDRGGVRAGVESQWISAKLATRLAWGFIVLGAVLRLTTYWTHPFFRVDEQLITLNVATRSFLDLWRPLTYAQTAPLLFLWVERLAALTGGVNEWSLRLVPLAAGLLTLPLIWHVGRRVAPLPAAVVALGLVAIGPVFVFYSAFVKPYTTDVVVTLLLVALALDLLEDPRSLAKAVRLGAGGLLALVSSSPAIFVLLGILVASTLAFGLRSDRRALGLMAATGVLWGIGFTALMTTYHAAVASRTTPVGRYMHDFWYSSFLISAPPGLAARSRSIASSLLAHTFIGDALTLPRDSLVLIGIAVFGIVAIWRRSGFAPALLLLAPLGITIVASTLERYPLADRVMLFAAPLLAFLLGAGAIGLLEWLPLRARLPTFFLVTACLAIPWLSAFTRALHSRDQPSAKDLIGKLGPPGSATEAVYVFPGGVPAWLIYTTEWSRPDRDRLRWAMAMSDMTGPASIFRYAREIFGPVPAPPDSTLVYTVAGRREILGLPSGVRTRFLTPRLSPSTPDSNWARDEVRRMRSASTGCIRTLWLTVADAEYQAVKAEITRVGARVEEVGRVEGQGLSNLLDRVCFN